MIRYLVAMALVAAMPVAARAQDMWRHEASGIAIPREIGDMHLRQEQDASGGGNFDVILQYGEGPTIVTVYVYRSAFPNPALWFERTRMAMSTYVGAPGQGIAPNSLTLGGASAPNGLREDVAIPGSGRFRATSVAIAQAGEWILKARISSQALDRAGVAAAMDRLLGAIRFANMPAPHPLLVPAPCADETLMNGRIVEDRNDQVMAAAMTTGLLAHSRARGASGLAAEPAGWCRESSEIPAQYASIYRRRDGSNWVALLGDSGRAVAGIALEDRSGRAATFVSVPASTSVAAIYDGLPEPDSAVTEAMPIVAGQARGILEIGTGAPRRDDK